MPRMRDAAPVLNRGELLRLATICDLSYPPYTQPLIQARLPGTHVTFFENTETDTQAYLIRWRDRAVLVFRGTQVTTNWSWTDIATNLKQGMEPWITGGRVHRGYGRAFLALWPALRPAIKDLDVPLTVTGHSLGGVLATLASTLTDGAAVSFGAPAAGDRTFAARLKNVTRVVHDGDIAPKYPRPWLGYRHGGTYLQINHDGTLVQRRWHTWFDTLFIPFTSEGVVWGVRHHSIARYVERLGENP